MYNYSNLSDIEFENLCKDVIARKLNKDVRTFAKGRDDGIDIACDLENKEVVVQVKHYIKSNVSVLMSSLKKEKVKIEKIKPKECYIFYSNTLSPNKVSEIYKIFEKYMGSDKNIITSIELDDFLSEEKNKDILKKHYKLWLESINMLEIINNKCINMDSQVVLSDIKEEIKYYVETDLYKESLEYLKENNVLFITGLPGVGKTTLTKMIILNYVAQNYKLKFTSNSMSILELKNSITHNLDEKEIIVLDDCFGQTYFNLEESRIRELLTIIKHVREQENKIIIFNSRLTIYQEAKAINSDLVDEVEEHIKQINMEQTTIEDKEKIVHNHLYFNVDEKYYEAIKKDGGIETIVKHRNYNPRIIEYVTKKRVYNDMLPSKYFKFILENLNNPQKIWEDEYNRKIKKEDRLLLTTLYSLTENRVDYHYLKKIYEERISKIKDIDNTKNIFSDSIKRLDEAFIKVSKCDTREVSVINPSVNDFLRTKINKKTIEYNEILEVSKSVPQLKRLLNKKEFEKKIIKVMKDGYLDLYSFETEKAKMQFCVYYIVRYKIYNKKYKEEVLKYLEEPKSLEIWKNRPMLRAIIYEQIFNNKFYKYYDVEQYFSDYSKLEKIINEMSLFEILETTRQIDYFFPKWRKESAKTLSEKISKECKKVFATDFLSELHEKIEDVEDYEKLKDEINDTIKTVIRNKFELFAKELSKEYSFFEKLLKLEINIYKVELVASFIIELREGMYKVDWKEM